MTARHEIVYGASLARIHHEGFTWVAESAAATLLSLIEPRLPPPGLVVDLGCGSGALAKIVQQRGYDVLGYDLSPSMIEWARVQSPGATFRVGSIIDAEIPKCVAVSAVGEVFNYLFDPRQSSLNELTRIFRRIYDALIKGGTFLFDLAGPGRAGPKGVTLSHRIEENWVCVYSATEQPKRPLVRKITTFIREGNNYTRSDEEHQLRLYAPVEVSSRLKKIGFNVRTERKYDQRLLGPGWTVFVARKK